VSGEHLEDLANDTDLTALLDGVDGHEQMAVTARVEKIARLPPRRPIETVIEDKKTGLPIGYFTCVLREVVSLCDGNRWAGIAEESYVALIEVKGL
jgi:hypothetical protein